MQEGRSIHSAPGLKTQGWFATLDGSGEYHVEGNQLEGEEKTQNDLTHVWDIKKIPRPMSSAKGNGNKEIGSLPLGWKIGKGTLGQWGRKKVPNYRVRLGSGRTLVVGSGHC